MNLPDFPEVHFWKFWKKTNKDSRLIQERRVQLEYYFNNILNDPHLRGHKDIKAFVRICKNEAKENRSNSLDPAFEAEVLNYRKSKSAEKKKGLYLEKSTQIQAINKK